MKDDCRLAWQNRHKLWLNFVQEVEKTLASGRGIGTGPSPEPMIAPEVEPPTGWRKKVVICSPHPDDEAVVGALALRLRLESGAEIVNCAVTLGGKKDQRPRRLVELEASCRVLGFRLIVLNHPAGLDNVTPETRTERPQEWEEKVKRLAQVLDQEKPEIVFLPHVEDFHPTHVGTHYLALDALTVHQQKQHGRPAVLVETEYWHELAEPNLLVGLTAEMEAILVMATAEHGGEVTRNPYHICHPARMMDNVRRGSEVVGERGGVACTFPFGELYRLSLMRGQRVIPPRLGGRIVGPTESLDVTKLAADFYPQ